MASAIVLKTTYGYIVEPHTRDPFLDFIKRVQKNFVAATVPGAWLVDIIPLLKHLPDWAPGSGFKRTARLWKEMNLEMTNKPYEMARRRMAQHTIQPCYVSRLVELEQVNGNLGSKEEDDIRFSAAMLYTAGSETTMATIRCFFLAMSVSPDVQRKAQEEIDRILPGTSRLPSLEDRETLPYVNALVKETFRWHAIVPMGVPHTSDEDDVYEGYFIPKHALLIPANWWFLHDPSVYHDPRAFKPERYFEPYNEPDPRNFVFGYGRRIRAGRQLADSSIFHTIALSLAVFDIRKEVDENGEEIEPNIEFEPGILSHAVPFGCRITPRTKEHEELIRRVEVEHPWEASNCDFSVTL